MPLDQKPGALRTKDTFKKIIRKQAAGRLQIKTRGSQLFVYVVQASADIRACLIQFVEEQIHGDIPATKQLK